MKIGLRLSDVSKSYGGRPVLGGITHVFEPGRIYALMGANGAGKSTLLRIACMLEEPDSGKVSFFEEGAMELPVSDVRLMITLVLPEVGLFNDTVLRNAAYGLRIRGIKGEELKDGAMECLRAVGLEGKRSQNALTLSTGEARRLGLARALAIRPAFILLDEPTASLDPESSDAIEGLISGLRGGPAVIMSTHDPLQAGRLADVSLRLEGGKLVPA